MASATVAAPVATTTAGGGVAPLIRVGEARPPNHIPRAGVPTAHRSIGCAAATAADHLGPLEGLPCRWLPAGHIEAVSHPSGGHRAGRGDGWGGATVARPPADVCSVPWRISRVRTLLRAQRLASAPIASSCPSHRIGRPALTVERRNKTWTLAAFFVAGVTAACSMVTHESLLLNLTARAISHGLLMPFKVTGCSMATTLRVNPHCDARVLVSPSCPKAAVAAGRVGRLRRRRRSMRPSPCGMRRPGADILFIDGFAGYTADGGANSCFAYGTPDR